MPELILTIEQRHAVYINALNVLKAFQIEFPMEVPYGLCLIIERSTCGLFNQKIWPSYIPDEFPEFGKHKPEEKTARQTWWRFSDYESRIKCLESCIEQTNPIKQQ